MGPVNHVPGIVMIPLDMPSWSDLIGSFPQLDLHKVAIGVVDEHHAHEIQRVWLQENRSYIVDAEHWD